MVLVATNDAAINEHEVELDLTGAEIMYELTNLSDLEFEEQLKQITHSSGL